MRFGLLDLLFAIACIFIGTIAGQWLGSDLLPYLRFAVGLISGICLYLALVYPVYRGLKLFPLVLPRCPCCEKFGDGFHVGGHFPRIIFRCPTCEGEFVVWHNGKAGAEETWDKPVLVLKWPYALGIYRKAAKPE